mmetsp:Transcript_24743/g.64606  ORF Transcript_24743/g.64606 Transcript_24743/m.64606 type:complete len:492 (-) Transcript_24743:592-2067(-)
MYLPPFCGFAAEGAGGTQTGWPIRHGEWPAACFAVKTSTSTPAPTKKNCDAPPTVTRLAPPATSAPGSALGRPRNSAERGPALWKRRGGPPPGLSDDKARRCRAQPPGARPVGAGGRVPHENDLVGRFVRLVGVVANGGAVPVWRRARPGEMRVAASPRARLGRAGDPAPLPGGVSAVLDHQDASPEAGLAEGAPGRLGLAPAARGRPLVVPRVTNDEVRDAARIRGAVVHGVAPLVRVDVPVDHQVYPVLVQDGLEVLLRVEALEVVLTVAVVPGRVEQNDHPRSAGPVHSLQVLLEELVLRAAGARRGVGAGEAHHVHEADLVGVPPRGIGGEGHGVAHLPIAPLVPARADFVVARHPRVRHGGHQGLREDSESVPELSPAVRVGVVACHEEEVEILAEQGVHGGLTHVRAPNVRHQPDTQRPSLVSRRWWRREGELAHPSRWAVGVLCVRLEVGKRDAMNVLGHPVATGILVVDAALGQRPPCLGRGV